MTIAVSTVIQRRSIPSTLSPAISALLLKPQPYAKKRDWCAGAWIAVLGWFFKCQTRDLSARRTATPERVGTVVRRSGIAWRYMPGLLVLTGFGKSLPTDLFRQGLGI